MLNKVLLLLLLSPIPAAVGQAQNKTPHPDLWQPLRFFAGAWEGTSKGQPGNGSVEREYRFALNGAFLEVKNRSSYPQQEKNPKGETHEDHGFISYDKQRKKFVLRQFHVEGFVNQYALTSISADGKTITFESESIENIPAGWRARETYKLASNDELVEVFELAAPGKEFAVYSESALKRKKSSTSADAEELTRLETVWNEAHTRGDAEALDRLWAEELVVTVPNMPVMTKPESLGIWRSGRMKFQRYQTSEVQIRVYGETAVVTGRLERTRNLNGRDVEDNWRFTKVYIRREGRWQVVSWQASTSVAR